MRVLITGAAGFFGHHLIEHILKTTEWEVVGVDALTYAGELSRLRDIGAFHHGRVKLYTLNFNLPIEPKLMEEVGPVDVMIHCGAETHVDSSIKWPEKFVTTNVLGTTHMLQWAVEMQKIGRCTFVYFSTDEVHGPAPEGVAYKETDPLAPTNPYSASKAGGEMMVRAFGNTFGVPWIITRTMNLFGERQHMEKFIPLVIGRILAGQSIDVHANADRTKAGSRFYIHCRNAAAALLHILEHGRAGEVYNIVGEREVDNEQLVQMISGIIGKQVIYRMVDFHSSRPGHDLRYALDGSKLREMGWTVPKTFEESLAKTVHWYLNHGEWLHA